jgi:hypothetical protein
MARAIGLLEAFGLAEEVGAQALTFDEVLWMAEAKKRKGCALVETQLTPEDVARAMELGRKCRAYKEGR